ncbi:MAG TPA: hypothetical protein VF505_14180 [Thermoanaerobaculia bacterium]
MNQNRKAELQRKLSMTSVPKPPAGLSERLKADIPENLMSVERDRARLSRSTGFSMRVAASIILLVTSVYVALHMVSKSRPSIESAPPAMIAARKVAAPPAEVTITLAENKKDVNRGRVDEVDQVARREQHLASGLADERAKLAKKKETTVNEVGQIADAQAAAAPTRVPASFAPPPPTPEHPAAVAEAMDRAAGARNIAAKSESITVPAAAPAIAGSAQAADFSYAPPRAVFGLSIDPTAFDRVKHDIENGDRPTAGSVDVSALINYFAGTARAPRHDVRLDVEASRAPLATDNTALVRFTVDTPREEIAAGASVPPVATNADLEITLNSTAVLSHRLIGADQLQTQSTLLKNVSVTGLMDLKLKPGIAPRTTIATLKLSYRSVADGRRHEIIREVHAADVTRTWAAASRRHRLATLGAVWSESLSGERPAGDVATTAERLATEKPEDDKARDLAAAATASSRLGPSLF